MYQANVQLITYHYQSFFAMNIVELHHHHSKCYGDGDHNMDNFQGDFWENFLVVHHKCVVHFVAATTTYF